MIVNAKEMNSVLLNDFYIEVEVLYFNHLLILTSKDRTYNMPCSQSRAKNLFAQSATKRCNIDVQSIDTYIRLRHPGCTHQRSFFLHFHINQSVKVHSV